MDQEQKQFWAFDCEWVPDLAAGRALYRKELNADSSAADILNVMWKHGGATPEKPQPFLKTIQCRLASISAVVRVEKIGTEPKLHFWSIPALDKSLVGECVIDEATGIIPEEAILKAFLEHFEKQHPTLIGFNSRNSDMHILFQRAFIKGLQLPAFFKEAAAKPWNQVSVDLMDALGSQSHGNGYGASLNEVATLSGIPGKLDTHGEDVAGLFYAGKMRDIVEYNMFDVFTTYLVWLRYRYFQGCLSPEDYETEKRRFAQKLVQVQKTARGAYIQKYIDAWKGLGADESYFV